MPHKTPFTDWVYDAWDQLVLDKGAKLSLQERQAGWRALYDRCYVDGAWTIPIHDAELVTSLGFYLGWETGSYEAARGHSHELLDHPGFAELSLGDAHEWRRKEANAAYLCGDKEHAIKQLRQIFDGSLPRDLVFDRSGLMVLLEALGPDHVPDEGLVGLVADVIAAHPGRKRLAKSVLRAKTTTELFDALHRCFKG